MVEPSIWVTSAAKMISFQNLCMRDKNSLTKVSRYNSNLHIIHKYVSRPGVFPLSVKSFSQFFFFFLSLSFFPLISSSHKSKEGSVARGNTLFEEKILTLLSFPFLFFFFFFFFIHRSYGTLSSLIHLMPLTLELVQKTCQESQFPSLVSRNILYIFFFFLSSPEWKKRKKKICLIILYLWFAMGIRKKRRGEGAGKKIRP